jgi:hypothetical protein
MWLKKLEPGESPENMDVINLKPDAFLVIHETPSRLLERELDTSRSEYLNRLIIPQVVNSDSGMYICVVNDPNDPKSGFKFKSAYLHVNQGT